MMIEHAIYMMRSRIEVFANTHSPSMMIYILEHDGCKKTELYHEVVRNSRMPDKLNALEGEGLIKQIRDGRSTRIFITDKGREVARLMRDIAAILDHVERSFGSMLQKTDKYLRSSQRHGQENRGHLGCRCRCRCHRRLGCCDVYQ